MLGFSPKRKISTFVLITLLMVVLVTSTSLLFAQPTSPTNARSLSGEFVVIYGDNFETGEHTTDYALRLDSGDLVSIKVPRALVKQLGGVLDANGQRVSVALNGNNRAQSITPETTSTRDDWAVPGASAHWQNLLCKFSDVTYYEPASPTQIQTLFEPNIFNRMPDYFSVMSAGAHAFSAETSNWAVMSLTHADALVADTSTLKQKCFEAHGLDQMTQNVNMMFNIYYNLGIVAQGGGRLTWLSPEAYMVCEPLSHCEGITPLLSHEMGHAYGMPHSDNNNGDENYYDNTWDPMSSTGDPYEVYEGTERYYNMKPYNNFYRWKVGFMDGSEMQVVPMGTDAILDINNFNNAALPGKQLAVMPLNGTLESATRLIAVEVRHGETGGGYEDHLPYRDGVLIYDIDTTREEPARLVTSVDEETAFAEAAVGPGYEYVDSATDARVEIINKITGGFTVSMKNTTPPAGPAVSIADATWAETDSGSANLTFTVSLSSTVAAPVTVAYTTADSTAVAGQDYVAQTGSVTIPANTSSATFNVSVLGDTLSELTEKFGVVLVEVTTGNAALGDRTAVGIITDNDPLVTVSMVDTFLPEGDDVESTGYVEVKLSAPSGRPVWLMGGTDGWLNYPNRCGLLGVRYEKRYMVVFFPPGSTSQFVPVNYCGNDLSDGDVAYTLYGAQAQNAELATWAMGAQVTIVDDDGEATLPAISFENERVFWYESASPMVFQIGVDRTTTEPIVLSLSTMEYGIATPDMDFVTRTNVEVIIPPGSGRRFVPFEVELINDDIQEYTETFAVVPTIVSGSAQLGPNWLAQGWIEDDENLEPLTITVEDAYDFPENEAISSYPMGFYIAFNRAASEPITLDIWTSDGTATAGEDYEAMPVTRVVVPANSYGHVVYLTIIDDTLKEGDETLNLHITLVDGDATVLRSTATGIIVDDPSDNDNTPSNKPSKPLLTTPVNNAKISGITSPVLAWTPNPSTEGVTQYKLVVKNDATGKNVLSRTFTASDICASTCAVDFSTLSPAITLGKGTYNWVVTASKASANAKSAKFKFTIIKPAKPVAVTPTGNVTLNMVNPTLTFSIPDQNITEAKVTVKDAKGKNVFTLTAPTGDICVALTCNVTVTAPLGGGSYSWTAQVFNVNGKSASKAAAFKIVFPDKPVNLAPTGNTNVPTFTPVLTWSDVVNAGEYRVTLTPATGKKTVIDWIASGANGFQCDAGVCTLDLAALDSAPVLKKGNYSWVVEARNTALHPTSKTKSAKAKFKVVIP